MPEESQSPGPRPVTIDVERADRHYRIATADLETIASQLRGKSSFSVFNSVILPISLAALTAFLTTLIAQAFQYVSWRNSTAVQEAQNIAAQAQATYDRAAAAVAQRSYATFVFIDAVTELANRKVDVDSHLYRLDLALNKLRFDRYHDQLKSWNEGSDQMIGDIDFHLDRPVGVSEPLRRASIGKVDCKLSMTEQMQHLSINRLSLKLQFGIIRRCFAGVLADFSLAKDAAVMDKAYTISPQLKAGAETARDNIVAMTNEFRCYALGRIQFLNQRVSLAIFVPQWMSFVRETPQQREAKVRQQHFDQSLKDCKFY